MEMKDQLSKPESSDLDDKTTTTVETGSKQEDRPLRLYFGNGPRIHKKLCIEYGVVDKVCEDCGKVGELTCFSASFRKWALKRVTVKELNQTCSRCHERGHTCVSCDLPIAHRMPEVPAPRKRKPPRCGLCSEEGHTRRTCIKAVVNLARLVHMKIQKNNM